VYRHYDYGKLTSEQATIVADCHNLIFKALHIFHYDPREYYDAAAIGLCKAVQSYPLSGASCSFKAYAIHRIGSEIWNARQYSARHNIPTVSLDAPVPWLDGMTLLDTVPDRGGGLHTLYNKRARPCYEHGRARGEIINTVIIDGCKGEVK
jgi:hypothetical protein